MTLSEFRRDFVYRADVVDGWRILTADDPTGDCDDYALTAAYIVSGGLWALWWGVLTRRVQFWYCKDPNDADHLQLFIKGHGWTDNWHRKWSAEAQHKNRYLAMLPIVAWKMAKGKIWR